jgi:hypothetical protein
VKKFQHKYEAFVFRTRTIKLDQFATNFLAQSIAVSPGPRAPYHGHSFPLIQSSPAPRCRLHPSQSRRPGLPAPPNLRGRCIFLFPALKPSWRIHD